MISVLTSITSNESILLKSINSYWFFFKASKLWDLFAKSKVRDIRHLSKQHVYNNIKYPPIQISDQLWLTIRQEKAYKALNLCQFNLLNDKIRRQILILCQFNDKHLDKFGLSKKQLLQGLYFANLPKPLHITTK